MKLRRVNILTKKKSRWNLGPTVWILIRENKEAQKDLSPHDMVIGRERVELQISNVSISMLLHNSIDWKHV